MIEYDPEAQQLHLSADKVAQSLGWSQEETAELFQAVAAEQSNTTLTVLAAFSRLRETRRSARLALANVQGRNLIWDRHYLSQPELVECVKPYAIHFEEAHRRLWVNLVNHKGAVLWTGATSDKNFVNRFASIVKL